jgi:hypothetical protein
MMDGRTGLDRLYAHGTFAAPASTFRRFVVQPWFTNIGANSIAVGISDKNGRRWTTIAEKHLAKASSRLALFLRVMPV